jgi:YidC/Oxa1 family membrane protein insertase
MDATQAKMMMYFMPIMITVFMLFLPSGLCLYMLTNSALGIAQMQFNNHRLANQPPLLTSEDAGEADAAPEPSDDDSSRPQRRRPKRKRRVRSGRA